MFSIVQGRCFREISRGGNFLLDKRTRVGVVLLSFDLLFQLAEIVRVEELGQGDFKAVAELLDRDDAGVLAVAVHDTLNGAGVNCGNICKPVEGKPPLIADIAQPFLNTLYRRQYATPAFA